MSNKTINQNIEKLELMMESLESESVEIEKAIETYKEAKKLADTIQEQLKEAKLSIEMLEKDA